MDETLAFQWEDLDGLVRELRVARSLSRGQVSTPKAGRGRTVDLSQVLAETLEQLQQARTNEAFLLGWPALAPWIICARAGTPMYESKVRRAMRQVLD